MVLSNFTTTYQRDYSGDRARAFRVQSARPPAGVTYRSDGVNSERPKTRAGPEVKCYNGGIYKYPQTIIIISGTIFKC